MSYEVYGFNLPADTLVYYDTKTNPILIKLSVCLNVLLTTFYFDPCDELYATVSVRKFWKLHSETHPHATLFIMLYKKLNIGNM